MTESKHTPGPWKAGETSRGIPTVKGPSGESVCMFDWRDLRTQDANARLIAAAPDLFDALCALVLNIDAGGATLGALADARAAIAKAKGRS